MPVIHLAPSPSRARAVIALALLLATAPGRARAGDDVVCPPGSEPVGDLPPEGLSRGCEDGDGRKHGPFREWHETGALKAEGAFERGQLNGPHRSYHPDGKLESAGQFRHGELEGHWRRAWSNGHPRDEGAWVDGAPHGEWTFYREDDGMPERRGRLRAGVEVCTWTEIGRDGIPRDRATSPDPQWCPAGGSPGRGLRLAQFSLGGVLVAQPTAGGGSSSAFGGWVPRLRFSEVLALEAALGLAVLKRSDGGAYASVEALLGPSVSFGEDARVGLAAGVVHWADQWTGTRPALGVFLRPSAGLPLRLSYARYAIPDETTHAFKLTWDIGR